VYYLRNLPEEGLRTRSSSYRGEQLQIELVDDLEPNLYTQASTPQFHRYRIGGVPENSGFFFRWRVEAGGTVYEPASTGSQGASVFAEDNQEIYLPMSLLQLLERHGVRQVRLVCEIELFGPRAEGGPITPMRTETFNLTVVTGRPPADF
jgi:hypothetical protein